RELEQLVELVAPERDPLRGRLHLDEAAVAGDDHVQVDVRARVLDVVEVEEELAADDPERDGGDGAGHRLREAEPVERAARGDPRAGDRRAASPSVRLEDVAVEPERALAERLEIGDRTYRPADQALDLDRAALLPARRRLALGAL